MPELPEVNTVMKGFRSTALNQTILAVEVDDDHILRNCHSEEFISTLKGEQFIDTYRQGKYFFAVLSNGLNILFHLGMTGDFQYYHEEENPRFERFVIHLENGLKVGFTDQRKFARILIIPDIENYLKDLKLGPDALQISRSEFQALFEGRNLPIKSFLMDQHVVAGIGNLYADEICYQCKIHPASITKALSTKKRKEVYQKMIEILQTACDRDAYYQIYPEDWFWKWRQEGQDPHGKGRVEKMKIGGRTTYYITGYQKLYQ